MSYPDGVGALRLRTSQAIALRLRRAAGGRCIAAAQPVVSDLLGKLEQVARLLEHRRGLGGAVARHRLDFLGSRQDLRVCRFVVLVADHLFRPCSRKTPRHFTCEG